MTAPPSMFKTSEGQARYIAAYDETLALWPAPVTPLTVNKRFGPTHINVCGPDAAPPLVLLPGAAISSTMWYPNIAALSQKYRVYCVDILGEMGKSVRTQPMTKLAEYIVWLGELFGGLQLQQAYVAGISFGGSLALHLACTDPKRVMKLVLLSPATLLPIRPQFYARIAPAILVPFLSPETRQRLFLGIASANAAQAIKQLMTPTDFQYKMFFPPVTRDDALRTIQSPTLLLLGENEVIYNPRKALKRAERLIPNLEADILSNAGHALNLDQPETVNERILAFLRKDSIMAG